eukprot:1248488-Rhodomonas_salina.3
MSGTGRAYGAAFTHALAMPCLALVCTVWRCRTTLCPILTYACSYARATRCAELNQRMVLRECYAVCGTEPAYGATRDAGPQYKLGTRSRSADLSSYTMPRTDTAHAAILPRHGRY